jgi:hypothetical protein
MQVVFVLAQDPTRAERHRYPQRGYQFQYPHPAKEGGCSLKTYTGIEVDPFNISLGHINIVDIAHSLSQLCRFNGHTLRHYSVAQHCVLVSRLVDSDIALEGLMHDAEEAYTGDMTTQIKHSGDMFDFCQLGEKISLQIFKRFNLQDTPAVHDEIKVQDTIICEIEKASLFRFATSNVIVPLQADAAEMEFLSRFNELYRLRHSN